MKTQKRKPYRRDRRARAAVALTAALLFAAPPIVLGHDPGLSSLELVVTPNRVIAMLSLAAADLEIVVGARTGWGGNAAVANGADVKQRFGAFALQTHAIRIDERILVGSVQHVAIDDGGGHVQLSYDATAGTRIGVGSDVPARLARGHRELVSIRGGDGSLLAEHLLDAQSPRSVTDLRSSTDDDASDRRILLGGLLSAWLVLVLARWYRVPDSGT